MLTKTEQALGLFKQGFSCSQAVVAVYAEDFGLAGDTALRISQAFGGGIARTADWCGAVTGAFMVIGLKHGRVRADDSAARDATYALVREFVRRFTDRRGAFRCRDLLGCDIGTPEGAKYADDHHLHETRCEPLIADAVDILAALL
jgi:C_GCAxxG_C_C family probable redox protein